MSSKLKKDLRLLDVFCIASGAMISSGLFILPGLASAKAGPALFLSYIIASFFVLPAMLSQAELATAMPKAGGDYFFITRSMGAGVGTIGGSASWFSLSLKSAFALVGMGAYAALVMNVPVKVLAIAFCLLFTAINIWGVREASMFQRVLVIGLILALILYVIRGFPRIDINRFVPFAPYGESSIFATAGFVFISYGGLTKIASLAEEVKHPGRNIPLGMILSIIIVGILYALVVFVTTGLMDGEALKISLTPISDGAHASMGKFGNIFMAIAAMLAFISTANAGIMAASRYPIAMSRDKILPDFFNRIHEKFKTPHVSIIFTSLFMIMAIVFLRLELLVKVASTFLILLYIFINLAAIIMRESKIQNYRPRFRAPFYPWLQLAGVVSGIFLLFKMGTQTYAIMSVFIACGFTWYMIYVRPKVSREFALIHVIKRITAREITTRYLETELKTIIRERDNIVEDRFDHLIKGCTILDLEKHYTMDEFFKETANVLAKEFETKEEDLYALLKAREAESSTVIRPGLAIPHIIVKGEDKFRILLARCREGITFPGAAGEVNMVFVLAGTREERNFHLRALAAIAEIAQDEAFDKKWLDAKNKHELRDIILLAERKRWKKK